MDLIRLCLVILPLLFVTYSKSVVRVRLIACCCCLPHMMDYELTLFFRPLCSFCRVVETLVSHIVTYISLLTQDHHGIAPSH